jgi:hypothetical protein
MQAGKIPARQNTMTAYRYVPVPDKVEDAWLAAG